MSTPSPCVFVWHELMTTDLSAALSFYSQVVGWRTETVEMGSGPYGVLYAGEQMVGGMMALPPEACEAGALPGWMGYVGVADVETCVERMVAGGGQLLRPAQDIPGVGRFAVVADPQGAALIVFRDLMGNASSSQRPAGNTPGAVGWNELHANDQTAAFAFYQQHFGWDSLMEMDMGDSGVYRMFGVPGPEGAAPVALGGMLNQPAGADTPPGWLYYFNVVDVDAALARALQAGGRLCMGPHQVPGGSWIVHAVDPQGAQFALVGPRPGAVA